MKPGLNIRIFSHSLVSDWNHGNAHFLRGLARALGRMGHQVRCYEQLGSWSLSHLVEQEQEQSIHAIDQFRQTYRALDIRFYRDDAGLSSYLENELRGADVVIIHEWNEPKLVNAVLGLKQRLGFLALFHDTHHRAYTSPAAILRFHLHRFDAVLAFGEALRRVYHDGFGVERTYVFHEAADVEVFRPRPAEATTDVLWIGNWGDEERTRELEEYLLQPAKASPEKKFVAHGVRYPESALQSLQEAGIEYRGYLPNLEAPRAYAESALSLHVPRVHYTNGLSGIPTIRVFEALACGAVLLCSPWNDVEGLFRPGQDFVVVSSGAQMTAEISHLLRDEAARKQIAANGLETVRAHHTCEHRARQLTDICMELAA
jgi:spore maturation protein CgeB